MVHKSRMDLKKRWFDKEKLSETCFLHVSSEGTGASKAWILAHPGLEKYMDFLLEQDNFTQMSSDEVLSDVEPGKCQFSATFNLGVGVEELKRLLTQYNTPCTVLGISLNVKGLNQF